MKENALDFEFIIDRGNVPYTFLAGGDMVAGRMPIEVAHEMCSGAPCHQSEGHPGYVTPDDRYFFAAKIKRHRKE